MQQLGLELLQGLSDRLPGSQLPATVIAVKKLPCGHTALSDRPRGLGYNAMVEQMVQG